MKRVGIIGVSGKLGQHLARRALELGYEVVGVCRERSVPKLGPLAARISVVPGPTNDARVVREAIHECDGVLTVLVPWGVNRYSSGTARAVLSAAKPGARLVFSCGWHVPGHPQDVYPRGRLIAQSVMAKALRAIRVMDIDDQVAAASAIYASDARWTVVRASTLEEGESEGLPVWADYVGHPDLEGDRTRRIDYADFMIQAMENPDLIGKAPAINGCRNADAASPQA